MAAPTPQQLADQVVMLGNQVTQLMAMVSAQQVEITALKGKKEFGWNGSMDRKQTMPEKFERREQWKYWSEPYFVYMEEVQPLVAQSLDRATTYTDTIDPTYPTPEDRRLAKSVYNTVKT